MSPLYHNSQWSAYCLFGRDSYPGKSEILPGVIKAPFLIELALMNNSVGKAIPIAH
ncbi:MAG: hypothetical protein F6K24_52335 [Okeania sp. SIO2D1]|uniref:hypothetical protein n=1 Tax=Okeania sp. SIO2C9 TaxID=2607791 RepID=UPI0013B89B58|nr:hypothetical protein [Okeania sp. SIO2C9]NEQ74033.1 hypothetical protein [Okeania sp. SIO2C9]NES73182.1 hypothetical protein [Okeania sp. SIO2D1]